MSGRGPAPDAQRIRRGAPARGEWRPASGEGWQHPVPDAPAGISPAAAGVWTSWFASWWAANWSPDDLPTLRLVIRLWDRVNRGDIKRAAELRQWLDGYGITPKGRQDRRWTQPVPARQGWTAGGVDPYAHLRTGRYDHLRPGAGPSPSERSRAVQDEAPKERPRSRFETLIEPGPV